MKVTGGNRISGYTTLKSRQNGDLALHNLKKKTFGTIEPYFIQHDIYLLKIKHFAKNLEKFSILTPLSIS